MPLSKRIGALAVMAIAACSDDTAVAIAPSLNVSTNSSLQPTFGGLVTQTDAPPPISGGTLVLSRTQPLAVAADPDRDRVYVVDLDRLAVRHTVQLPPKSEPGRVTIDDDGRAHVALRRTHQLATIDLATGAFFLRSACIAPRGVAFDRFRDQVIVACASGDLAVFAPAGGERAVLSRVGSDLRDVIVRAAGLQVSELRRAALHEVTAEGDVADSTLFPDATVAWRATTLDPDDDGSPALIVSQATSPEPVSTGPGGYGSGSFHFDGAPTVCGDVTGIVGARVWLVDQGCPSLDPSCSRSVKIPGAVLPVDVAGNGREVAVVAAGNAFTPALAQLFVLPKVTNLDDCAGIIRGNVPGQATALGYDSLDRLVVQTREPARLHIMSDDRTTSFKAIELASDSRADTGHSVFHANAGGSIACASCHPEGGDDGHVWSFEGIGPRRTPSLLGTTNHTEPFHWDGDMKDLSAIAEHVFEKRMGGPRLDGPQTAALGTYMAALPAPPPMRQAADASAGKPLFEQRCASCHANAMLTNNETLDVGTNGRFQVPSLVGVAWRGPWMHDGCAKTLFQRFEPACGGTAHADLAGLDASQLAEIAAFMETF